MWMLEKMITTDHHLLLLPPALQVTARLQATVLLTAPNIAPAIPQMMAHHPRHHHPPPHLLTLDMDTIMGMPLQLKPTIRMNTMDVDMVPPLPRHPIVQVLLHLTVAPVLAIVQVIHLVAHHPVILTTSLFTKSPLPVNM